MAGESLNCLLTRNNQDIVYDNQSVKAVKKQVGTLLVENFMKQVFEDGFFHADPHPGNLFLHVFTDQANRPKPFQVKQRVGVLGGVDYSLNGKKKRSCRLTK